MTAPECPSCHTADGRPHTDYCPDRYRGDDVSKFRKKPVVIEAVQFTRARADEALRFLDERGAVYTKTMGPDGSHPTLILTTVHGDEAPCRIGDWIIPDGKPGTFYPCKPDIFEQTYEPVEDRP